MADQEPVPLPTCPMAETCKRMMERPFSGVTLIVPGLVFIGLGLLVFIEPRILAWIMAAAFVLLGVMMLFMANFIRNVGTRFRDMHRHERREHPTA